ncbi:MAG: 4'-phosphopantetheinyl transferase [Nitrospirales bacterium]|nr:MAG: 4'-phosphopantetheinyl transferase [Nitrospirales bacterium]
MHIWKVGLTPHEDHFPKLLSLLSPDECTRAQRFKFQEHRQAFIAAHSALRLIMSRYLLVEAQSLVFSQGPQGKPFLNEPFADPPLLFNLSHTQHVALYAFALNREVGIDLEYKHRNISYQSLIERICSEKEKAHIMSHAPPDQKQVFLACWTRKEAYVKATGKGLSFPLQTITVSLPPTTPTALLEVAEDVLEPLRWTMHEIQVDLDHVAALVVAGHSWNPVYWEWSWEI